MAPVDSDLRPAEPASLGPLRPARFGDGGADGHVPAIDVRYLEVTLTIATARNEGLTKLDFDVAQVLDSRL